MILEKYDRQSSSKCLLAETILKNVKTGEITVVKQKNVICDIFSKLIAANLKGQVGFNGITYWAVGTGGGSPGSETSAQQFLENEIARGLVDIKFAMSDGSGGYILSGDGSGSGGVQSILNPTPVNAITNILRLTVTFGTSEANGALNEFGLFGGNATSDVDTGVMVDYRVHGVITKTNEVEMTNTIYIQV